MKTTKKPAPVGRYAKDVFRHWSESIALISAKARVGVVQRITAKLEREPRRNDQVAIAAVKAGILEVESRNAEFEALDGYIIHTKKLLQSLEERKAMLDEGSQYHVKNSPLRSVGRA